MCKLKMNYAVKQQQQQNNEIIHIRANINKIEDKGKITEKLVKPQIDLR